MTVDAPWSAATHWRRIPLCFMASYSQPLSVMVYGNPRCCANSDTPTPWVKVFELPEHVLFNHERHIKRDIACESCHGEVRDKDRLKGKRFQMGFCLQCHREKQVNIGCWLACHS